MTDAPSGIDDLGQVHYDAPDCDVVYLINETLNGGARRRLAARYVLDCLRSYRTPDETAACLRSLEHSTLLELAADVQELAGQVGLLTASAPLEPRRLA
jgi:hypothetical protein